MIDKAPLSMDSARRASDLLEAWTRRDLNRLKTELVQTSAPCAAYPAVSYGEIERRELLQGIAQQMSGLVRYAGGEYSSSRDGVELYLGLLRHLASSPS